MKNLGDLVSATSMLVAVVGMLISLWYSDLIKVISLRAPDHVADAGSERRQIRTAIATKGLPLSIASWIVATIVLPDTVLILSGSLKNIMANGLGESLADYDALQAAVLATTFFALFLAAWSTWIAIRLFRVKREFAK